MSTETQSIPVNDKFFNGRVNVGEHEWLVFERKQFYCDSNYDAIIIKFVNTSDESNTILGVLHKCAWTSPNEKNANLLWNTIKRHPQKVMRIMTRLKTDYNDFSRYTVQWKCFRRRFKLEWIKLSKAIHLYK
jgi:hypothetical protein